MRVRLGSCLLRVSGTSGVGVVVLCSQKMDGWQGLGRGLKAARRTGPCAPRPLLHPSYTVLQARVAHWLHLQRTRGRYINQEIRKSRWVGG